MLPHVKDMRFTFTPVHGAAFDVVEFTLDEALSETYRLCVDLSMHGNTQKVALLRVPEDCTGYSPTSKKGDPSEPRRRRRG